MRRAGRFAYAIVLGCVLAASACAPPKRPAAPPPAPNPNHPLTAAELDAALAGVYAQSGAVVSG